MPFDIDLRSFLQDPQVEGLFRLIAAGVLAGLIGAEREMEGKPAGMRTYGLVGMGAAAFTVVGLQVFGDGDPASRVGQGIVTGIGFLGAGTILHMRRRVIGLTTAAGIWVAAAIGMAIGGGLYILGIGAAISMLLLLQFVRPEFLVRFGMATQDEVKGKVTEDRPRPEDDE